MTNHVIAPMRDESPKTILVDAKGDSWESNKRRSQSERMVTDLHAEFCKDTRATLIDLMQREGQAHFSSWLLYDALGSDLYEKITTTPEYYICRAETEVLTKHLHNFAKWTERERHVLVELGSGVGTKTHQILPTLQQYAPEGDVLYAPIDVDAWALQENKQRLAKLHPKMKFQAFEGLFEDALPRAMQLTGRKTILFQGSTFGNFKTNADQLEFLRLVKSHMSPGDRLVLGVDCAPIPGKKSEDVVHDCYRKNTNGYREEFMLNGLTNAARKCGLDLDRKQWKRITEWDKKELCVSHYYETLEDVTVHKVETKEVVRKFKKGERMLAQTHFKYTDEKLAGMAKEVGMCLSHTFKADNEYFMWAELTLDEKPQPRGAVFDSLCDSLVKHLTELAAKDSPAKKMLLRAVEEMKNVEPPKKFAVEGALKPGRRFFSEAIDNFFQDRIAQNGEQVDDHLLNALRTFKTLEPNMDWIQTEHYRESLGEAFMDKYCYTNLVGTKGLCPNEQFAMGFLVLGPDVHYPDHNHAAEELYIVLGGDDAFWGQKSETPTTRPLGDIFYNPTQQFHEFKTGSKPLFGLYIWLGDVVTYAQLTNTGKEAAKRTLANGESTSNKTNKKTKR